MPTAILKKDSTWKRYLSCVDSNSYTNTNCQVNKFFVQNAQRSLLQRLLQRTSYATSIRISVKNYRKYKHALLVTSQYIQKFTKYVTSNKKKRAISISKISDMKYYYYSLALSSFRQYTHQKRTIANTIVMTKTNTNKMRKFMLFWKKRIRRHHRSLTKITKVASIKNIVILVITIIIRLLLNDAVCFVLNIYLTGYHTYHWRLSSIVNILRSLLIQNPYNNINTNTNILPYS